MIVDQEQCSRCGKEIAAGDTGYCPDCQGDVKHRRLKRGWFLTGTVAILILAGAVYAYGEKNAWDFSWDAVMGRPAAVVNGEPLSRSALKERLTINRRVLEREYGKELFTGDRGGTLLAELERDVLEKMVKERLVVQEASRLKITVGDESIRQELQKIAGEIYGTWDKFQASLKEDGISPEYITDHVRNLLLFREVNKAKAGGGSDQNGAVWLVRARQNADVKLNLTAAPRQASLGGGKSGCGAGGCGGCGRSRTLGGEVAPELKSKASAAALAKYRETNPAGADVQAQVTDFGCHVQVDIEQAGRIVKSYSYQDGQAFEN